MIESWKELPLGIYRQISEISPDDEEGNLKLVALLDGKTYGDILNEPLEVVKAKVRKLDFLAKKPKTGVVKIKYRLGGNTYRFDCSASKITTAQYIDFSAMDKNDLTGMLSIFLIPEGKRYSEGYEMQDVRDDIDRYLSVTEALTICDFFTILLQVFLRRTLRAAKKALRKARKDGVETKEAMEILERYKASISSDGFPLWTL